MSQDELCRNNGVAVAFSVAAAVRVLVAAFTQSLWPSGGQNVVGV